MRKVFLFNILITLLVAMLTFFIGTGLVNYQMLRNCTGAIIQDFFSKEIGFSDLMQLKITFIFLFIALSSYYHSIVTVLQLILFHFQCESEEHLGEKNISYWTENSKAYFWLSYFLSIILLTSLIPTIEKKAGLDLVKFVRAESQFKLLTDKFNTNGLTEEKKLSLLSELEGLKLKGLQLSFNDLARFPDLNKGKPVQIEGKVLQVVGQDLYRIEITQTTFGWTDAVAVEVKGLPLEYRILENDHVLILGYASGIKTFTGLFDQPVNIPFINARSVTLINTGNSSK